MSTISHQPTEMPTGSREWPWELLGIEVLASLTIFAIWIAVAVTAGWGSDLVTRSSDGSSATIPSAIPVALFASVATWAVAKYGLGRRDRAR